MPFGSAKNGNYSVNWLHLQSKDIVINCVNIYHVINCVNIYQPCSHYPNYLHTELFENAAKKCPATVMSTTTRKSRSPNGSTVCRHIRPTTPPVRLYGSTIVPHRCLTSRSHFHRLHPTVVANVQTPRTQSVGKHIERIICQQNN